MKISTVRNKISIVRTKISTARNKIATVYHENKSQLLAKMAVHKKAMSE